jgi:hypothetical protein
MWAVRYITYCDFSTCGPRTSSIRGVVRCQKMVHTPVLRELYCSVYVSNLQCVLPTHKGAAAGEGDWQKENTFWYFVPFPNYKHIILQKKFFFLYFRCLKPEIFNHLWKSVLGNFNTNMINYSQNCTANIYHSIDCIESNSIPIIIDFVTIWKGPLQWQSCTGLCGEWKQIWYECDGGWEWQSARERIHCRDVTSPAALSAFMLQPSHEELRLLHCWRNGMELWKPYTWAENINWKGHTDVQNILN